TGQQFDGDTGLYYLRARFYDPTMGRFTTRDPIGYAGGNNVYAYVGNNPINGADPSGLQPPDSVMERRLGIDFNSQLKRAKNWSPPRPVIVSYTEGIGGGREVFVLPWQVDAAISLFFFAKPALSGAGRTWRHISGLIRGTTARGTWSGAGKVIRLGKKGDAAEEIFAQELADSGYHVQTRFKLQGADLLIEGAEFEYKRIDVGRYQTLENAVTKALSKNGANNIVLDARKFSFTAEQMGALEVYAQSAGAQRMLVITKEFDYVWYISYPP
ncbi:MAG: RHS repeat-associated core domain-containing protein, partial [Candidatus Eremiobacterota bacterium]